VKDHNPNYENDESDEQEILAMVGTFSLWEIRWRTWFGHAHQLLRLSVVRATESTLRSSFRWAGRL